MSAAQSDIAAVGSEICAAQYVCCIGTRHIVVHICIAAAARRSESGCRVSDSAEAHQSLGADGWTAAETVVTRVGVTIAQVTTFPEIRETQSTATAAAC